MGASWIRGGAGLLFAGLGLSLWLGGSGSLFGSAIAAAGCRDDATCAAERQEEGTVGPGGRVDSVRATCQGDCGDGTGGQICAEISRQNADGSRTFQCSCNKDQSPDACSGFATVKKNEKGEEECTGFQCIGECEGLECRLNNSAKNTPTCPTQYTLKSRCECQ